MGPGIVVVLTWLGAGDIVNSAMAGGNYGYALMWVFVLCLMVRYLFVSTVAKYQLSNERGETVLGGLVKVHPLYAPFVLLCVLGVGHAVGAYLLTGAAVACVRLTGLGHPRVWAVVLCVLAYYIAFRPVYRRIEKVFFFLVGVLSICFLTLAAWSGPSPGGLAKGLLGFAVPETVGRFDTTTLMLSMLGAVAGGLANLMYPYFIREKGWITAEHRRVQQYDLLLGIAVLILLDLAVWVVGAEILHPRGIHVVDVESLARLLGEVLGGFGTTLFYVAILAALFSNILGTASAYAYLGSDAYGYWRSGEAKTEDREATSRRIYRPIVIWIIVTPLAWPLLGQSDFVGLTLLVNAAQVVLIPVLVTGLWIITARSDYIGAKYRNRWWENLAIGLLLLLGCISTYFALAKMVERISGLLS
jgi:Mn2+/Fe2+ NRAMP family transporter